MPNIVIVLDKYSDWLEAYSVIKHNPTFNVQCYWINNSRNDSKSIKSVFDQVVESRTYYHPFENRTDLYNTFTDLHKHIHSGDIFVAPFVRYRNLWKLIRKVPINITTVHLSECFPDTFGPIGYRIAFRGRKLKSWLTLPFAKIYAVAHKPDICYFPLYPFIENPFVKKTYPIEPPPLINSKAKVIKDITGGIKRPLLIGGFGYNVEKMAKHLGLKQFIATSKNIEIIVDGKIIPLEERICAEEVLLSGCVSSITSYSSSVMAWAKLLYPAMPIQCYESNELNRLFGRRFSKYTRHALSKIDIELNKECVAMLD